MDSSIFFTALTVMGNNRVGELAGKRCVIRLHICLAETYLVTYKVYLPHPLSFFREMMTKSFDRETEVLYDVI